tara:strand:+ start:1357 stop:1635 length:279 start_codon:yes stop_codon:yes gene_type:complete
MLVGEKSKKITGHFLGLREEMNSLINQALTGLEAMEEVIANTKEKPRKMKVIGAVEKVKNVDSCRKMSLNFLPQGHFLGNLIIKGPQEETPG